MYSEGVRINHVLSLASCVAGVNLKPYSTQFNDGTERNTLALEELDQPPVLFIRGRIAV
jgi:hypothetical protein